MPHNLAMAKFRTLKKKKPTITKRGETERKVCKKMEKKGQPKWVKGGMVLEQMSKEKDWNEPGNPLARLGTAIQQQAYKVSQRKDLTKGEKTATIQLRDECSRKVYSYKCDDHVKCEVILTHRYPLACTKHVPIYLFTGIDEKTFVHFHWVILFF